MTRRSSKMDKGSAASRRRSIEPKRVALLLLVTAVVLVPWTAALAVVLPSNHVARHWDVAWAGFDVALTAALAITAVSVWRRWRVAPFAATASATLLVVDAWFDVLTARGGEELRWALLRAVLAELPLALVCAWVARRSLTRGRAASPETAPHAPAAEQRAAGV